jgi:hypothetical protein
MYEELRKEVDWEHQRPDGEAPHGAAFDDSGNFCVADIWESEEHLNKFLNNKVLPVMKKINIPMPDGEIFKFEKLSIIISRHSIWRSAQNLEIFLAATSFRITRYRLVSSIHCLHAG